MAKKTRKKTDAGSVVAEFGHEEAKGGGSRNPRLPEGDYVAKIIDAKQEESQSSGNQMITWTFEIVDGKHKGKKIKGRTVLVPKALFMLRNLLEALGKEVPEKTIKVKYGECVGERIGISLEDGEYNGKTTTEVNDFLDPDAVGTDDDEDEDDEDDEDEDGEEEIDLSEMDRKELKEHIKTLGIDVKVTKKMDEDDIREAIEEADGDDEDDDDEDMDEVDLDEL